MLCLCMVWSKVDEEILMKFGLGPLARLLEVSDLFSLVEHLVKQSLYQKAVWVSKCYLSGMKGWDSDPPVSVSFITAIPSPPDMARKVRE